MRDELDGLLDRYAPEAGELWLSALPEQAPEHEFSPKFRRKVEKLLRRQRRSAAVNAALRYGRRAAAFALVFLTLSFSCLMTVDAAFRERVIQAVVQVFQEGTYFYYDSRESTSQGVGEFRLTYLPNGMKEVQEDREKSDLQVYYYFEDEDGDMFALEQVKVDENTSSVMFFDTENAKVSYFEVHGVEAMGIEKGLNHTIHWVEGNFVYTLSGTIPLEELKLIAEGIQTIA